MKNNFHISLITIFISIFSLYVTTVVKADNLCLPSGYTFGFFNGVWNTPTQASDSLAALRSLIGNVYNDEPIQYEVFYNHTGSTVDGSSLQDIAEVFEQRAAEIDSSGELGKRWEFFWECLTSNRPFTNKILEIIPTEADLFSQLYTDIMTEIAAGWSYILSNPPTQSEYARHNIRLDALATQKQKLILVAHSQGNLFLNHAYDYIVPTLREDSVKAAHIAPASPTLRGPYVLANIDLVINSLRVQGLLSVPPSNIVLQRSISDISGHTLIGTYLDSTRPSRSATSILIKSAIQQLKTPSTTGNTGSFTITLTWDGSGDVDLHVFEPNGSHVYYENDTGIVGFLDMDNVVSYGPEHYYASCDSDILENGTYPIALNNFYGATGRIATVQAASSKDGVLATKILDVGPVGDDQFPLHVFNVSVSTDPATKAVSYSVE